MSILIIILAFLSVSFAQEWKLRILEEVRSVYSIESLSSYGKPFKLTISSSEIVAALARHDFYQLELIINQGVLSSPRLSPDSLRMILCHELGHLFGGGPRKDPPLEWEGPVHEDGFVYESSEGQADYYAGLICFKNLIQKFPAESIDLSGAGPQLKSKCSSHPNPELCLRTALAGYSFLRLVWDFPIDTEAEDPRITPALLRNVYPDRQCRLDTIIRGGLCDEDLPLTLNLTDDRKNQCGRTLAQRPACWFR